MLRDTRRSIWFMFIQSEPLIDLAARVDFVVDVVPVGVGGRVNELRSLHDW